MELDTYCKIYIDTSAQYDTLFDELLNYLAGTRKGQSTIITSWSSISFKHNSYYNKEKYLSNRNDFVYWMYYIDMDCLDGIAFSEYIDNLNRMITHLKSICTGVIPSCDFEDMLV